MRARARTRMRATCAVGFGLLGAVLHEPLQDAAAELMSCHAGGLAPHPLGNAHLKGRSDEAAKGACLGINGVPWEGLGPRARRLFKRSYDAGFFELGDAVGNQWESNY